MTAKIVRSNFSMMASKALYYYFKDNLNDESLYAVVSYLPDSEHAEYISLRTPRTATTLTDSDEFLGGSSYDFDALDSVFYNQNALTMHKIYSGGISRVIKRVDWTTGVTYNPYPLTNNTVAVKEYINGVGRYNIYQCLFSPRTASYNSPYGIGSTPLTLSDGYVWKYMYTVDAAASYKFVTPNWLPVLEQIQASDIATLQSGSAEYDLYNNQNSAVPFELYAFGTTMSDSELRSYLISVDKDSEKDPTIFQTAKYSITFEGKDFNLESPVESNQVGSQRFKVDVSYDSDIKPKFTFKLSQKGKGYWGPAWVTYNGKDYTGLSTVPAPGGGHSSDVPTELNARHLMMISKHIPDPDEKLYDIMNNSRFNLISLVDKPVDALTKTYAKGEYYIACKGFTTRNINTYKPNDTLYIGSKRIKAIVTAVSLGDSEDAKIIYYVIPDYDNRFDAIKVGDIVQHYPFNALTSTIANNIVTGLVDREIIFNKSNLILTDYSKTVVQRSVDQIETLNFMISFD